MHDDLILTDTLQQLESALKTNGFSSALFGKAIELSKNYEQELRCHRQSEAQTNMATTMESEATKVLTSCILDTDGNVVRPDFNRGRK